MDRGAKRDWTVRLAALVIFVLGFAAGAFALELYRAQQRSTGTRERFSRMLDDLDLDAGQRDRVKAIFDDAHAQMDEVRKECGPKFHAVREQTDARLREVLTPEQWQRWQQMTSEGRERHRHDHDGASP